MAMTLYTNVSSLSAQRHLRGAQEALSQSLKNLSSGLRVNEAKDDVAGIAIDNRFKAYEIGLREAWRNTNDAISMAQVGEGALQEIGANLQRIRELAVQSANGGYASGDRTSLHKEVSALKNEIRRVIEATDFNGVKLLASAVTVTFQLGHSEGAAANQVDLNLVALHSASGTGIGSALGAALGITTQGAARSAIALVDRMLDRLSSARSDFGTLHNRFEAVGRFLDSSAAEMAEARSRITDSDYAGEMATLTRNRILQQTATAMLSQANASPQSVLSLLG